MMARIRSLVIGMAVGAVVSYLFDAEAGAGRRERLQRQLGAALRRGRQEIEHVGARLHDRAWAAVAQLDEPASGENPADDLTVLNRVESALAARTEFPRTSLSLEVVDGRLALRGDVDSEAQARDIVDLASRVEGVRTVENLMRVKDDQAAQPPPAGGRRTSARRRGTDPPRRRTRGETGTT